MTDTDLRAWYGDHGHEAPSPSGVERRLSRAIAELPYEVHGGTEVVARSQVYTAIRAALTTPEPSAEADAAWEALAAELRTGFGNVSTRFVLGRHRPAIEAALSRPATPEPSAEADGPWLSSDFDAPDPTSDKAFTEPSAGADAALLYNAVVQPDTIWFDDLTPEMQEGWRRGVAALSRPATPPLASAEADAAWEALVFDVVAIVPWQYRDGARALFDRYRAALSRPATPPPDVEPRACGHCRHPEWHAALANPTPETPTGPVDFAIDYQGATDTVVENVTFANPTPEDNA